MRPTFFRGVALGAATAILVLLAATAVAGTGVGGVFNLGADNAVNKTTTLRNTASFTGPQLQVKNSAGDSALDLQVNAGTPPLTVNTSAKIAKLNADELDGLDSTAFARRAPPPWTLVSGTTPSSSPVPGRFICANGVCWDSYGSGFSPAAYTKDAFGFVHLKGLARCQGPCPLELFVLPAGYRPAERSAFPSTSNNGGGEIHARVDVRPDGTVVEIAGDEQTYITLEGITFLATH
jgi:hypothetical protein